MGLVAVCVAILFPAWAGVILLNEYIPDFGEAFPRMGGGDPRSHAA